MRLLLYGLNFWPELTGIGKYSGEMVAWLAERGHDVNVVTAPPYYPAWRVPSDYGGARYRVESWGPNGSIQITRCPLWVPRRQTTLRRLAHLFSFAVSSLPALWRSLHRRPEVLFIVVPTLFVAPVALLFARIFRVPAWIHVQDFEVDAMFSLGLGKRGGWLRRFALSMESGLLTRFHRASSISPRMVERLVEKGVLPSRTFEFPNWVDLRSVFPLTGPNFIRSELGFGEKDVVVLYAGNMGEKQGLEIVIDAAKEMVHESNVRFVFAGSGAARERLELRAAGLSNVIWLPLQPVDRLNEMLNAADIHVLPQLATAADLVMPSKLTGMLASGRATVGTASADTQLGQVLDAAGCRIDPGDCAALVSTLKSLSGDPSRRAELGSKGRVYAEQYLGIDAIMSRFEKALETLKHESVNARR